METAYYQQTEPDSVDDEMSCTFGTELVHLPKALSNYYKQFFNNRATIIGYEQKYQSAFTQKQALITILQLRYSYSVPCIH